MSASMVRLALAAALSGTPALAVAQNTPRVAGATAATPESSRKTLAAVRLEGARPLIDGRLHERAWASAEIGKDFVQMEPKPGEAASQRTEARVLYDDDAIYVGVRAFD